MGVSAYDVVRDIGKELSNWGRWGAEDECGTLNLIDPAAIKRGLTCVRSGKTFSLGLPLGADGPQGVGIPGRFNPQHYMTAIGQGWGEEPGFHYSDDVLSLPLQAATQWDSLAHVYYDDHLYNGRPVSEVLNVFGAHADGIDKQAERAYLTRGVLLDIARYKDVDRLAPSTVITLDDLKSTARRQGVTFAPGDILLLRTGHINVFLEDGDRDTYNFRCPGIGIESLPWLRNCDFAAVASDTPNVEVLPPEDPLVLSPVHSVALRDMGLPLGEMFVLEELAADCAADGIWEFLLSAQPLKVTAGIGSPVNPVAVK
jgi:kynurenine formamidase